MSKFWRLCNCGKPLNNLSKKNSAPNTSRLTGPRIGKLLGIDATVRIARFVMTRRGNWPGCAFSMERALIGVAISAKTRPDVGDLGHISAQSETLQTIAVRDGISGREIEFLQVFS